MDRRLTVLLGALAGLAVGTAFAVVRAYLKETRPSSLPNQRSWSPTATTDSG
jgi:hypothetical protein